MRLANFIEGLLFMIGFLFLCLIILIDRSPRRMPAMAAVPVPSRKPGPPPSITS
jgi:hypothetical protein